LNFPDALRRLRHRGSPSDLGSLCCVTEGSLRHLGVAAPLGGRRDRRGATPPRTKSVTPGSRVDAGPLRHLGVAASPGLIVLRHRGVAAPLGGHRDRRGAASPGMKSVTPGVAGSRWDRCVTWGSPSHLGSMCCVTWGSPRHLRGRRDRRVAASPGMKSVTPGSRVDAGTAASPGGRGLTLGPLRHRECATWDPRGLTRVPRPSGLTRHPGPGRYAPMRAMGGRFESWGTPCGAGSLRILAGPWVHSPMGGYIYRYIYIYQYKYIYRYT